MADRQRNKSAVEARWQYGKLLQGLSVVTFAAVASCTTMLKTTNVISSCLPLQSQRIRADDSRTIWRFAFIRLTSRLLLLGLLSACATLPEDYPKEESFAVPASAETSLGLSATAWVSSHDGRSGFFPLQSGSDALAARLRMIERAEVSLDAQYFLMKPDIAGHIFCQELLLAADRGVRVRFLLDDIFTTVSDEELFILDAHENIEVRLYNPIAKRGFFYLNFLGDFKRANRRMHNKSFIADNQLAIVGGRNIAAEYFDLNTNTEFEDFDVLGAGKVATDVSATFDLFWNSRRSLPLEALDVEFTAAQLDKVRRQMKEDFDEAYASAFAEAMNNRIIRELIDTKDQLFPADWEVVTDDPQKLKTGVAVEQRQLVNRLIELVVESEEEIIVITPYLVPLESGVEFWRGIVDQGTRVVMLTNSLASTNHIPVHSGYAKFRKPLLEAGVELYEARGDAVVRPAESSGAPDNKTLHTKLIIIDRQQVFAGSLNLDPRSIDLNAEIGVNILSEDLGQELADEFFAALDETAYRVTLDDRGRLQWEGTSNGVKVIESSEPSSSRWRRFKAWFFRIVPDSQL
jgi:putative cardiolipin synthase